MEQNGAVLPAKPIVALTGHTEGILALAFSPDRGLLASSSMDGTCRLWSIGSNSSVQRSQLQQQGDRFRSLAFGPNSRTLAAGSGSPNGLVWLYDVTERTPKEIATLKGAHGSLHSIAFSTDGKFVAAGGEDRTVRVWDSTSSRGEARTILSGQSGPITTVAFTPDGTGLATVARGGPVRIWTLGKIRTTERTSLSHDGDVSVVTFSSDGKLVATATETSRVRIWDISSLKPMVRIDMRGAVEPFRFLRFSEDSRSLIGVGSGAVVMNWDTHTGRPQRIWDVPHNGGSAVTLTRDGRYLAIGTLSGHVDVYRVAEKRT